MALDAEVKDLITTEIMVGTREAARLSGLADRNVTQGLAVVQNTVIQSVAATADDGQLFGAMRTAIHAPEKQGAIK